MRASRKTLEGLKQLQEAPPEVYEQLDKAITETRHNRYMRMGFRFSEEEVHAFKVAAEKEGETVSNWIRQLARAAAGLKSSKKR